MQLRQVVLANGFNHLTQGHAVQCGRQDTCRQVEVGHIQFAVSVFAGGQAGQGEIDVVELLLQALLATELRVLDGDLHRLRAAVGESRNITFGVLQFAIEGVAERSPQLPGRTADRHLCVKRHVAAQQRT
ncbi:hypothetical protein D3C78_1299820 [compost metagenome]